MPPQLQNRKTREYLITAGRLLNDEHGDRGVSFVECEGSPTRIGVVETPPSRGTANVMGLSLLMRFGLCLDESGFARFVSPLAYM